MSRFSRLPGRVILAVFFLSGFSALVYQLVWMRMLTLTFGSTVFAVSTVVSVFMGGLAAGSYVAGRYADRRFSRRELLRLYALLEAAIGVYCLLTPWLFFHLDAVYGQIYRLADLSFHLFSVIRFAFSALILVLPTALMGATLPVLSRLYTEAEPVVGRRVGVLYGLNTLGAVCGVLATGFLLLPSWGIEASLYTGVSINIAIAAVVYLLRFTVGDRTPDAGAVRVRDAAAAEGTAARPRSRHDTVVLGAFALSGFAALAYEVVWFRLLSMTIGSTAYAFAIMLAIFLLGIALGSHLLAPFADRIGQRARAFAVLQLGIGATVLALTPLFGKLPLVFLGFLEFFGFDFWAFQAVNFMTALAGIFLPTILMGAAFPLAVRLVTRDIARLGHNVGTIYCVNTLGGVAGSFLAGFVMIPVLGMQTSIVILAGMNVAIGCVMLFLAGGGRRFAVGAGASAAAIFVMTVTVYPAWNKQLLSTGVYFNTSHLIQPFRHGDLEDMLAQEQDLVYYNEGVTGTVTVSSSLMGLSLAINGKVTAGVPGNTFTLVRLAGIPLMLHPGPQDVMLLGLGSGTALAAMERFGVDRIDVLEISPEVVEAVDLFARYYDYHPLRDERVRLIVNDGRAHLMHSDVSYDVIVSAPPLPLVTGVANLFTQEFYTHARSRLRAGGLLCQWIPSYGLKVGHLKTMIRTFQSVFPHMYLWQYDAENIIFLGSVEPLVVDFEQVRRRLGATAAGSMLKRTFLGSADAFIGGYTMGPEALREFAGRGPLNTDHHPRLEFAVPRNLFEPTVVSNYNEMARVRPVAMPRVKVERREEGTYYPTLRMVGRMGEDWRLSYAGFGIRNHEIDEAGSPPLISKRIAPLAIWRNGNHRLRITAHSEDEDSIGSAHFGEHLGIHLAASAGARVANGSSEDADRSILWSIYRRDGNRLMKFSWHCTENDMTYVGELVPAPVSQDVAEKSVTALVRDLSCVSGAQG